ncbi:MAG: glycolate oxidase subunit GlcE [Hyphomicrobiales bacterium]
MLDLITPTDEQQLSQLVADANAQKRTLKIQGGGTRAGLGGIVATKTILSLSDIKGVNLYDPAALTLVAKTGTPLAEIEALLQSEGQRLAFEPMTHNSIYGTDGQSTIGGVVACNISGSRRIQVGACRDALLGVRYVSGSGEIVKNGGRVMKNVTGLDLVKLMAGSFGTLGILTEVAFKTLPLPERQATLVFENQSLMDAIDIMSAGLGSPFEVTGAAYIMNKKQVLLRVEGFDSQVDYRLNKLKGLLAKTSDTNILEAEQNAEIWQQIRNVEIFANSKTPIWKISVKPSDAIAVTQEILADAEAEILYDWGGGLMWVNLNDDNNDASAKLIRNAVAKTSGHATLVRASDAIKTKIPAFQLESIGVAKLSAMIKNKFDPSGILNPNLMGNLGIKGRTNAN